MWSVVFLAFLLVGYSSASLRPMSFVRGRYNVHQQRHPLAEDYKTLHIRQPVDHFGYANQDTYLQRYLVVDKHWGGNGDPIFFYCGNEGDIAWFLNNTGLMFDWAPEFKAMVVFAEHRYYGESMPYGADSYKDLKRLGYLSAEQALADFAVLIDYLKTNISGAKNSPVVAFGGSYGGMLASWFRMKYPHSTVGALAASAPIWLFGDLVPCDAYSRIATEDFQLSGPNCADNIRKSWKVISKMGETAEGRQILTRMFGLCQPLNKSDDVNAVKGWLSGTWGNLPMVDYPYPASFLEPLPAWPIKVVCSHLSKPDPTDLELVQALRDAVDVYYNYTGNTPCFNTSEQAVASLGDLGWDFQSCTEMVMPSCSNGVTDMFESSPWDLAGFTQYCQMKWGVTPRPNWILEQYGGKNITAASNIIFSNGQLDPWRGGGVTSSLSDTLVAIVIKDGAHHLDLRSANPEDPQSVIAARKMEKEIVKKWIGQSQMSKEQIQIPNMDTRCGVENIVIINGISRFPQNKTQGTKESVMKLSFRQSFLVFTILGFMFVFIILLVGLSNRRRGSDRQFLMTNSDGTPLL